MKTALLKGHVLGFLLASLLAGGCPQQAVNVIAADDICGKSVEVHLVGVNRYEKDTWEAMSMTDYWKPENKIRESARPYTHVIQFGQGPCEIALAKNDPIRGIWKNKKAEYLFVLADLPDIFPDFRGDADSRRLGLPAVGSEDWGVRKPPINIRIEGSNIVPLTIPESGD